MSDGTNIEWSDASWSVTNGCSRISPGCGGSGNMGGCYAEKMAWRLSHNPATPQYAGTVRMTDHGPRWTGTVTPYESDILLPLRWRKRRRVFVNSMSDLFHDDVPDEHIDRVFATMLASELLTNQTEHTYQVLTKRAARMRKYLSAPPAELLLRWGKAGDGAIILDDADRWFSEAVESACAATWDDRRCATEPTGYMKRPENLFPLRNVWLGVSVESQEWANRRVPDLLACPASVRWLSVEPMLGPVDLRTLPCETWMDAEQADYYDALRGSSWWSNGDHGIGGGPKVDWVVCGAESGTRSRPMEEAWARSLRDQCEAAGVSFFYKQAVVAGKKVSLPILDGRQHTEFPR